MNRYVTLLPIAILILTGIGVVSQAFAITTITMETDKHVYDHSSVITVTGQVEPVDLSGSEITIIIVSPLGGVSGIQQLSVNSDGSFSTTIDTSTKYMKYDGVYDIRAQYSSLAEITVSVELTPSQASDVEASETEIGTAVTGTIGTDVTGPGGESFYKLSPGQIEYDATCNTIIIRISKET